MLAPDDYRHSHPQALKHAGEGDGTSSFSIWLILHDPIQVTVYLVEGLITDSIYIFHKPVITAGHKLLQFCLHFGAVWKYFLILILSNHII